MSQPSAGPSTAPRTATVTRKTAETDISVSISLDASAASGATQTIDVQTGIGFLDHVRRVGAHRRPADPLQMLHALAKHGGMLKER